MSSSWGGAGKREGGERGVCDLKGLSVGLSIIPWDSLSDFMVYEGLVQGIPSTYIVNHDSNASDVMTVCCYAWIIVALLFL